MGVGRDGGVPRPISSFENPTYTIFTAAGAAEGEEERGFPRPRERPVLACQDRGEWSRSGVGRRELTALPDGHRHCLAE